jgi:hypothetical protein
VLPGHPYNWSKKKAPRRYDSKNKKSRKHLILTQSDYLKFDEGEKEIKVHLLQADQALLAITNTLNANNFGFSHRDFGGFSLF